MNSPQTFVSNFLGRLFFVVFAGSGVLMGAPISEVQHQALPRFESEIEFVPYKGRMEKLPYDDRTLNPRGWSDVRIVAINGELVTISGYPHRGKGFLSEDVHVMCFPLKLRPRLLEAAAAARPILAQNDPNAILLTNGKVLPKASIVSATPNSATIEFEGGSQTVGLDKIASSYRRSLALPGKFVYFRELTLNDGRKLAKVRVAATDSENCRIAHEAGSLGVPLDALPEVERKIVSEQLIGPGLFAAEVITDPDLLIKRRVHAGGAPAPKPTPAAVLEKAGFNSYAVLPLKSGAVLRNAKIVGVGPEGVTVLVDGSRGTVSKSDLPEEVYLEAGGTFAPMFAELLTHGVVAKGGSEIFELLGQNPQAPDFEDAAKKARGGRMLARVGPGYLLMEGRNRNWEGAAVQFPKPPSNFTRGYIMTADFAHLGVKSWREWWHGGDRDPLAGTLSDKGEYRGKFEPVELNKDMLLLDPFEARFTLFGNEQGAMKRAWRIEEPLRKGLAIVETKSGFYLGVLVEKSDLAETHMTWAELLAHRSGGYNIEKTGQRQLQPGSTVFQANGKTDPERLSRSLQGARLQPGHYRTLIDRGVESTRLQMETSQADNVEILAEPAGDFSRTKEVDVEKVTVQFRSMAAGTAVFQVVVDQREREVERTYDGSGAMGISGTQWKSRKVEKSFELETELDGGLRFLEGDTIYELTFPKVGGYLLATYSVKANPLSRAPR
jgi:hypothetical protein